MTGEYSGCLVSGTIIDGVKHRILEVNEDVRGSFTEIFSDMWDTSVDPRQWSIVKSRAKALRGMHIHLEHDEYICVTQGRACIGLYDPRRHSRTYGSHALIEASGDSPAFITFPRGILHGWYFYEPSMHVQAISNTFEEYGTSDNWGCYFADPALGIPWPNMNPFLSERACNFPGLEELMEILDTYLGRKNQGNPSERDLLKWADTSVTKVDR